MTTQRERYATDPDMTARQRLDALADLLAESLRRQQDEAKAAARTTRETA